MGNSGNPSRRRATAKPGDRRGFTLFGLMLAVSFCCLILAFFVGMRESTRPRHTLDREAFSADGSRMAAFFRDGHVDVFDTESGAIVSTFHPDGTGDEWQPYSLPALSADGRRIVVVGFDEASQDSIIQVWDTAEDRVLQRLVMNGVIVSVAISPDGSQVAIIPPTAVGVSMLDTATGELTTHTPANLGAWLEFPRICYAPDGRRIALGGLQAAGSMVAVMDAQNGVTAMLPTLPPGRNSAIGVSPDGQRIGVRIDPNPFTPKLWILDGPGFGRARSLDVAYRNNFDVSFSPDSKCVIERQATAIGQLPEPGDPNVFTLETLTPSDRWRVPFDYRAVASAAPLAVTMRDRQFTFYDMSTGEPTGVKVAFGAGEWPLLVILVLFFAWVFCLAMHRNRGAPKILCPICGRSMPAAKKTKDICQLCQASLLSVPESQRRLRKIWLMLFVMLLVLIGGGFIYSLRITLLFVALFGLLFGWSYLRLRRRRNLVRYLDRPISRQQRAASADNAAMRHWSIDASGDVQSVGSYSPDCDKVFARQDEMVRRSVARARATFARLLGREFDFSPGVNITSFAEFEKLRELLLQVGSGQARISSIYALRPMRRVLFCETEVRAQLLDPEAAIGNSLSYVLFDTKTARHAPAWLQQGVNHLVAFGDDASESHRLNRALRACLASESLIEPVMLRMRLKQLYPYWRQSNNYDAYRYNSQLGSFAASLVEFLTTAATADLQTGFVSLFRAAQQGAAHTELIERHLHRSEEQLLTEWRRWVESRTCVAPTPTTEIEETVLHKLAPLVIDPQAAYLDRLRAIRVLGERGYHLGVESLRTVVENPNDNAELKRAAIYSLRLIEGG